MIRHHPKNRKERLLVDKTKKEKRNAHLRDKDTYSLYIKTKGEDYPPPNPIQEENGRRGDTTIKKDRKRWRKGAIAIKL